MEEPVGKRFTATITFDMAATATVVQAQEETKFPGCFVLEAKFLGRWITKDI